MKKLALTLMAFVLAFACVSGILAVSAETSEIQEVTETTTGETVSADKWTVSKKYFAVSYTMPLSETAGKAGENGCCGIILGGSDGYACVFFPHDDDSGDAKASKKAVRLGPWWSNDNGGAYKAQFSIGDDLMGKEATVVVLCSQEGEKLTIEAIYLNGNQLKDGATLIDNNDPSAFTGSCTLDNFNGKVGYATKLSGVKFTAKFVESDEKLDEKCFEPKVDQPVTPPTGSASIVIASVAVIALAGVVVASKKREQD